MNTKFTKEVISGDIAFSHPVEMGFYSKAVRFFTNSRWSHCFYVGPEYLGDIVAIESDLKTQVVPFHKEYIKKPGDLYEMFRPLKASDADIYRAAKYTFIETSGETYGFLQIPWFAVRAILNKLFKSTLNKNWFPSGVICSELLVIYIKELGGEYAEAFGHLKDDETSPEDLYKIVINRKDLFEFFGERTI